MTTPRPSASLRWITAFFDLPVRDFGPGVAFWSTVTGTRLSAGRGADGQFATLLPAQGDAHLRVQQVATGPGGCHLDLSIGTWNGDDSGTEGGQPADDVEAFAVRATHLGARLRHREHGLWVLDSPGGFPLCVVPHHGEVRVPPPVLLSPTMEASSRPDQICLDIPEPLFAAEYAFWAALLAWPRAGSDYPEFENLVPPAGTPVHLLFQRRARAQPGDGVTGHLDLACGPHTHAVAEQHVALGAKVDADHGQWIRMHDPVGRPYCLTRRPVGEG